MKRLMTPLAVFVLLSSSVAHGQDWAQQMFKVSTHDFGTIARAAKAEYEFAFQNVYQEDVHIASVHASCGCTSPWVKDGKDTLKTWETGAVVAHINSDKFLGAKGATITVTFDRPYYAEVRLQVRTHIRDDVVLNPGSIQFGSVEEGSAAAQSLAIGTSPQSNWRILDVKSDNPHLSGEVVEFKRDWEQVVYHLTVRLNGNAPAGYLHDHVMLVTDDPERSQIAVAVDGRVAAGVTVGPRVLSMGVLQPGQKVSKQVVVRGKEPFRITQIKAEGEGFEVAVPGADQPKQLHVVPVTFTAGDKPGTVMETIHIETDLGGKTAEFSAQAVVAGAASQTSENHPQGERTAQRTAVSGN